MRAMSTQNPTPQDEQDRRFASDVTTVGGTDHRVNPTVEEVQRLARRKLCQAVYAENPTREALMAAMTAHGISAQELHDANDHHANAIAHLRTIGVPDGFAGLKVWPQDEVDAYYAWHARTPNALNLVGPRPSYAQVQEIMDRDAGIRAIDPHRVSPWRA